MLVVLRKPITRVALAILLVTGWVILGLRLNELSFITGHWDELYPITDLQFLTSPTEAALGIGAAYIALDRFRFQRRLSDLIASIGALATSREIITAAALQDGHLNNDELNILAVWALLERAPKPFNSSQKPSVRSNWSYWISHALITCGLDRLAIIPLTLISGVWLFSSSCMQITGSDPSWLTNGFVQFILLNLLLTAALPCLVYVVSQLSFYELRQLMLNWHDSWAKTEDRKISDIAPPSANAA